MRQKNTKKLHSGHSLLLTAAKAVTLLLGLYFSCAMPILSGAGLIYNRESYGAELEKTGIFLIISAALMTFGAILCLFHKRAACIISILFSVSGFILCMTMLSRLTSHADASGWADKYTMLPVSDMYSRRILPCIVPVTASVIISAVQLFSGISEKKHRSKSAP